MPIKADCSSCGHSFSAASKYAGKKVRCPKCKDPLVIPAAKKSSADAKSGSGSKKVAVKCDCGKKFAAKAEWAGKKVKCPACKQPVRIPGGKSKTAAAAKVAEKSPAKGKAKPPALPKEPLAAKPETMGGASDSTLGGLFDEVGYNIEDGSAHRKCPECRAAMSDDAILCIECGYNENTGKKMETYRPVTADDRAKAAQKPDPAVRNPGKKKNAATSTPALAAIIPIVLVIITFVVRQVAPEFTFYALMATVGVTSLMATVGWWWIRSIAAADSPVHSMMCSYIPGYYLYYVYINWEETKDAFLLSIIPWPVLIVCAVLALPLVQASGG